MRRPALAPKSRRLRIALASGVVALCLSFIGIVFWEQDLRYSLPTPRPDGLQQPETGSLARLPASLAGFAREDRPVVLHFYSPQCPCSRFNLDHLRSLERKYGARARGVLVLEGESRDEAEESFAELGWGVAHVADLDGAIAEQLGVYSTPQVVILDANGAIAFRGNYNSSRYCVDERSQFARLALEDVLAGQRPRAFPAEATIAYGCALPPRP